MCEQEGFRTMDTAGGKSPQPFGGVTPVGFRSCFDQKCNGRVPAMMRNMPVTVRPRRTLGPDPKSEFESCVG